MRCPLHCSPAARRLPLRPDPDRDARGDVPARVSVMPGVAMLGGVVAPVLGLASGALHTAAHSPTVVKCRPAL